MYIQCKHTLSLIAETATLHYVENISHINGDGVLNPSDNFILKGAHQQRPLMHLPLLF